MPAGLIPNGDALTDVSDTTLSATLTITRGHYTKLSVPFAGPAALDAQLSSAVPPLGKSAVVLQFDDSAEPVTAPTNVSSFDVGALLDQLVNQFIGVGAAASRNDCGRSGAQPSPELLPGATIAGRPVVERRRRRSPAPATRAADSH